MHLLQRQWPLRRLSVFYTLSSAYGFKPTTFHSLPQMFNHKVSPSSFFMPKRQSVNSTALQWECVLRSEWSLSGVTVSQYHDDWVIRRVDLLWLLDHWISIRWDERVSCQRVYEDLLSSEEERSIMNEIQMTSCKLMHTLKLYKQSRTENKSRRSTLDNVTIITR